MGTGCDVHKMWQSASNFSLARQSFHLLTFLTEALKMTARTATDLLNRKSCVKLSTMMPPLSTPKRLDTFFSFALHSVNMRHWLLFSVQRLQEREKNPSRKKNIFPWKRQKKGKREAKPHLLQPAKPCRAVWVGKFGRRKR